MITVSISINSRKTIANISAIRVYPKSKKPRSTTICKYKMYIYDICVGVLAHPYGDGIDLGIEMLNYYNTISKKDIQLYETMSILNLENKPSQER